MEYNTKLNSLFEIRKSIRAFSAKSVEEQKLMLIIEAAISAPSSMNEQPWRFLIVTKEDPEGFNKVLESLNESNRIWAKEAPVLLVTLAKMNYSYKAVPNKHAWYDTGQAMGMLLIKATELDLFFHEMGGFSPEKLVENFGIEDGFIPIVVSAVGYKGDVESLPENLRERETAPRKRKPVEEIAFFSKWQNSQGGSAN